jgi:hypothetical protein
MKTILLAQTLPVTAALLFAAACPGTAQVIINEIHYDDSDGDDFEFLELFNGGASAVDISGWHLATEDGTGFGSLIDILGGTMLAPGAFYVFGNAAVPGAHRIIASDFFENDSEQIQLWSGPAGSTLVDGFVTEAFRGPGSSPSQYGIPSAQMDAQMGGGYHGNYQSGHINGQGAQSTGSGPVLVSLCRFIDGHDTNVNGRDFGLRRATPGASNSSGISTTYLGPNVDSQAVGTEAPRLVGAFINPRVVDPTAVSTHNPGAIAASPQGGNAVTIWDTEFGGTGAALDDVMLGAGRLNLLVYVDPRLTGGSDVEEWVIGLGGGADAFHSLANTQNGSTGLGWLFRRDSTGASLRLIDFGKGGPPNSWTILDSINLDLDDLGWHELGVEVDGTLVTGRFDDMVFNGSTVSDLVGNLFYASYREGFANNADPLLRPLTIDLFIDPGDFNGDGVFDCLDVDGLVHEIAAGSNASSFDLTDDGLVNLEDLTEWLAIAGSINLPSGNRYSPGDANLDGHVDGSDFGIWNANKFTSLAAWCSGDFTADGAIDGSDFGIWNANKFTSADQASTVPEPRVSLLAALALICSCRVSRRARLRT